MAARQRAHIEEVTAAKPAEPPVEAPMPGTDGEVIRELGASVSTRSKSARRLNCVS
jgi:hypothetical protein